MSLADKLEDNRRFDPSLTRIKAPGRRRWETAYRNRTKETGTAARLARIDMASWMAGIGLVIGENMVLAIVILVATLLLSSAVAVAVVVRLPVDYLCARGEQGMPIGERGILFQLGIVLKNLLGALLVIIGIILSVPGLPGQGLLTILAGVLLLDFRGKRKLLCRLLTNPALLGAVNRLRMRFFRPPLVLD